MPTEHREVGWMTGYTAAVHRDRQLRGSQKIDLISGTAASRRGNQQ